MMKKILLAAITLLPAFSFAHDSYDSVSGVLHMPSVRVDGIGNFKVDMMHEGDLVFKVTSATTTIENIVGSWSDSFNSRKYFILTFLRDGHYFVYHHGVNSDPGCPAGVEFGSYTYDENKQIITPVSVIQDKNGDCGFFDNGDSMGAFRLWVSNDILHIDADGEEELFERIK